MSNQWGNGWGLFGSSAVFGLAHTGQGQAANAVQAGQIGEGVATHYRVNVIAGIAAIRHGGTAQLVSFSLPF